MKVKAEKIKVSQGLGQLLSEDPGQLLLHAVESVQEVAHYRRVGRVLKHHGRRRESVGWVHASSMSEKCDRLLAADLLGFRPEKRVSRRLQRIFDNGSFMHLRWQNYFMSLPARFVVRIEEVREHWPIVGGPDIHLSHPDFGETVIELKSMNHNEWSSLRRERADHRSQLQIYLGLTGAASGQVWYESKDTQEVRIFCIEPDGTFNEARERALRLADAVLEGLLPPPCVEKCPYDAWVGDLPLPEERLETLSRLRESNGESEEELVSEELILPEEMITSFQYYAEIARKKQALWDSLFEGQIDV